MAFRLKANERRWSRSSNCCVIDSLPVYTCEACEWHCNLKSVQRKEPSCFSSIFFPPLPGCVQRARLLQNTFSELVLMSLIGPEVSAADHLLPIVIGHDVAATFTPLTPGGGVSQRHPPIFIVSPALALLFNQCEWFPGPISWRFDPRIQNLSSAIESSDEGREKKQKQISFYKAKQCSYSCSHA